MEIHKETKQKLFSVFTAFKNNDNAELETKLQKFGKDSFTRLINYLVAHHHSDEQKEVLDIFYEDYRISIEGISNISAYCNTGQVQQNDVTVISKIPLRRENIVNYGFRVNLKVEQPIEIKDFKTFMHKLHSSNELFFRFKKRFSFLTIDKQFRYDLTLVKSAKGKTFKSANVSQQEGTYEFEMEFVGDKTTVSNDALLQSLFTSMSVVIQVTNDSNGYILTEFQENQIVESYLKTSKQHPGGNIDLNLVRKKPKEYLVGPQPVTLEKINMLPPDIDIISILKDYTVTDKADGERRLVFINDINEVYLLDNRLRVTHTSITSRYKSCVLDAELIKTNRGYDVMCFDAYFFKGDSVYGLPLISSTSQNRCSILKKIVDATSNTSRIFAIKCKEYYDGTSADIKDHVCTILDKEKRGDIPYTIDGLIFTPKHFPVGAMYRDDEPKIRFKTWPLLLKWKPPVQNTIDFLVTFDTKLQIKTDQKVYQRMFLHVGFNTAREKISPLSYLTDKKGVIESLKKPRYVRRRFTPYDATDGRYSIMDVELGENNAIVAQNGDAIVNDSVVECAFINDVWHPYRVRKDKEMGNDNEVAMRIWGTIHSPVTESIIRGEEKVTESKSSLLDSKYSFRTTEREKTVSVHMADFHNWIKNKLLISPTSRQFKDPVLFDIACGKGGDLFKWKECKINKVLGIDLYDDNITNPVEGAYARLINSNTTNNYVFLPLDASERLNEQYFNTIKDIELQNLCKTVWGLERHRATTRWYGFAKAKFDVVSCQFAIHYFFKDSTKLDNFISNVDASIKPGGYFIGCCFDWKLVDEMLTENDGVVTRTQGDRTIWAIEKRYTSLDLINSHNNLGKEIVVYIDSINVKTSEYLVDFDLLTNKLSEKGIRHLTIEECSQLQTFQNKSHGTFKEVFDQMSQGGTDIPAGYIKKTPLSMSNNVKELSFLNKWFIFKKDGGFKSST